METTRATDTIRPSEISPPTEIGSPATTGSFPKSPASKIAAAVDEYVSTKRENRPTHANSASQLAHPCTRYLVLKRQSWKDETLPPLSLQYIFEEGNLHEDAVGDLLKKAGFKVIKSQTALDWPEQPNLKITGHIDGTVQVDGLELPIEIKSVSTHYFDTIQTFEDVKNHRYWFVKKWAGQLTLYLAMMNKDQGLMVLKNKNDGRIKILDVMLDYELAESLAKKAEEINHHVAAGTLPDPIEWDDNLCGRCGFYPHLCMPDIVREGAEIMDDPDLEVELERYFELKPIVSEYDKIDEVLKKKLKGRTGFCGSFEIGGKMVQVKGYSKVVPDSEYWKRNIKRLGA
jgi:CRISPR/Cas system-associated exonuclease Cas4 (RecB family)